MVLKNLGRKIKPENHSIRLHEMAHLRNRFEYKCDGTCPRITPKQSFNRCVEKLNTESNTISRKKLRENVIKGKTLLVEGRLLDFAPGKHTKS